MRFLTLLAAVLSLGISAHAAGVNPKEEAAIKKQIVAIDAKGNREHSLPDVIFWSGAFKRPVIGTEDGKSKQEAGEGSIADRKPATQKLVTKPQRIVVADSQDLAYEYSIFTLEFDTKAGKHIKFDGAGLRVWQKQGGVWKQAAIFARGYDD
jgi:ketosteroid isomerase-like protein